MLDLLMCMFMPIVIAALVNLYWLYREHVALDKRAAFLYLKITKETRNKMNDWKNNLQTPPKDDGLIEHNGNLVHYSTMITLYKSQADFFFKEARLYQDERDIMRDALEHLMKFEYYSELGPADFTECLNKARIALQTAIK